MPEHEKRNRQKREKSDQKERIKQKESETLFDQTNGMGQDVLTIGETPFQPLVRNHTELLANAYSDIQRANLVLNLQRTYGNAYVQRLLESHAVQATLTVSRPGDRYEQEAERVSEIVTREINSQINRQPEEEEEELQTESQLQRQPEEEEEENPIGSQLQRQPEEEEEETQVGSLLQRQEEDELEETGTKSLVQRQEEEEEETQTLSLIQSRSTAVISDLETRIEKEKGNGQSLSEVVRGPMEHAFGADFSSVKVHADTEADTLNRELNARAFTTGQDIFFRQGEYSPDSGAGQKLIAHELTHVIQQTGKGQQRRKVNKQKTTTANRKTKFSLNGGQGLWASTRQVESPNPFSSESKQGYVTMPTLSDSIAKVTLSQTKSSEVTIQRLAGSLVTPGGDITADWDGTKISKQFNMHANFTPENEQKYGEYRQYVKGYFSTPSGDLTHNMGASGTLDRKEYREDGPGQYGHRSNSNYDAENGKDIYDQPDRPTGKHYVGRDTPSLRPGGTGQYTMDLNFKGQLIDTRNSQAFITNYWHISRTVTKK